jgi:hypothetical protein
MPLSLLSFARKEVALEAFVPFDLSAARDSESFGCGSIGFDFGHLVSPIVLIVELRLLGGKQHGHTPPFQPWLDVDLCDILYLVNHAA